MHNFAKAHLFKNISCSILPELDPKRYGLNENDKVNFSGIINTQKEEGTVAEALEFLHKVYSKAIAVEFTHLEVINISRSTYTYVS